MIALLVSGGLDSYIAYHYLREIHARLVRPIFIQYSGKYSKKEQKVCEEIFDGLKIVNTLNFSGEETGEKAFIKNRNAYFALIGSNFSNEICMAGLKDDNVGDKSKNAFLHMSNLLNEINTDGLDYRVFSPFWEMEKAEIIEWYIGKKYSIEDLLTTTSCYHPTKHFCGECPSCFRKFCAFAYNGIAHVLPRFTNKKMADEYNEKAYTGVYTKIRSKSIMRAYELIIKNEEVDKAIKHITGSE